jgi:uncharacterized protein YbaR (Trm112 family)
VHILVTDVLSCPRCGPGFGLVLLAGEVNARRVRTGTLACPNCREHYPVAEGVADFGAAGAVAEAAPAPDTPAGSDADDAAFRLLALLGIAEPPALVLLGGGPAALGAAMAARVDGLEAICVGAPPGVRPGAGVSPLHTGGRLPFHSRSLRGVVLAGDAAARWLEEGARVLGRLGRIVLERAPDDATARLEAAGLRVLAADRDTIVATHN